MTEGFSFAYLKELFVSALLTIARWGTGEEDKVASDKVVTHKEDASKSTSNDGHVVIDKVASTVDCSRAISQTACSNANLDGKAVDGFSWKKALLEVEIPATLQGNVLLKVIHDEINILLSQMDNTKEKCWNYKFMVLFRPDP
jgi:transitional endoplasmic reticulum ATPase